MAKPSDSVAATVGAEKAAESKAMVVADTKKGSGGSVDRDVALAGLEKEKNESFIKAWEDSEKTKADNKAQKKLAIIDSWESRKKATLEAKLKQTEEEKDNKKADYRERTKNKIAMVHKQAEEKKAMVEAEHGKEKLKAEEMAAKYRATGKPPKNSCVCF